MTGQNWNEYYQKSGKPDSVARSILEEKLEENLTKMTFTVLDLGKIWHSKRLISVRLPGIICKEEHYHWKDNLYVDLDTDFFKYSCSLDLWKIDFNLPNVIMHGKCVQFHLGTINLYTPNETGKGEYKLSGYRKGGEEELRDQIDNLLPLFGIVKGPLSFSYQPNGTSEYLPSYRYI